MAGIAMGAEMPLQIADPQHQLGHGGGPGVHLDPQELVRIDGVAGQGQGALILAQVAQQDDHLAFQALHQFQRDIQEIARPAGRIQHGDVAQPLVGTSKNCPARVAAV